MTSPVSLPVPVSTTRIKASSEYQEAYEMGRRSIRPVVFPQREQVTENECRAALIRNPGDFLAAFNLCMIFRSDGRNALNILGRLPNNRVVQTISM